jgi:hypothetical protein
MAKIKIQANKSNTPTQAEFIKSEYGKQGKGLSDILGSKEVKQSGIKKLMDRMGKAGQKLKSGFINDIGNYPKAKELAKGNRYNSVTDMANNRINRTRNLRNATTHVRNIANKLPTDFVDNANSANTTDDFVRLLQQAVPEEAVQNIQQTVNNTVNKISGKEKLLKLLTSPTGKIIGKTLGGIGLGLQGYDMVKRTIDMPDEIQRYRMIGQSRIDGKPTIKDRDIGYQSRYNRDESKIPINIQNRSESQEESKQDARDYDMQNKESTKTSINPIENPVIQPLRNKVTKKDTKTSLLDDVYKIDKLGEMYGVEITPEIKTNLSSFVESYKKFNKEYPSGIQLIEYLDFVKNKNSKENQIESKPLNRLAITGSSDEDVQNTKDYIKDII